MGRQPRLLAPGLIYHIVARGNRRQDIFLDQRDYRAYLARLAHYRVRHDASVYAYCLMPNHVHILIRTGRVPLSRLMQGIQQSYTQYFNRRHVMVGHLFQGRYKAAVCADEVYLGTLVHYIHANPVRAGLAANPQLYRYSSHAAYLRGRPTALVDPRPVLGILGSIAPPFPPPTLAAGPATPSSGNLDPFAEPPEQPHGSWARKALPASPRQAVEELARRLNVEPAAIRSADRSWDVSTARALVAFTLVRRFGYPLRAVADVLGRDVTTVSVMLHRLAPRLVSERPLAMAVERLARPENV
jgi:REP element-mobilizing transposase RayT